MTKHRYKLLPLFILAGCAVSGQGVDDAGISWRPYFENDGSLQEISYIQETNYYQATHGTTKPGDYLGRAQRKVPLGGGDYTQETIAPVFASGVMPDGVVISTMMINGDTDQPVRISQDEAAMQKLRQARNVTVYTQGANILETIRYQSQAPICAAFEQGDAISARSVTNYYENNNTLLATVIESNIDRNDYRITKQDILRHNFDEAIDDQDVSKMNKKDVAKQVRILAGDICGIAHNPKFNP